MIAALGGGITTVAATKLHAEAVRARDALLELPITELAISLRTQSVITMQWPPPDRRETSLVSEAGVTIPMVRPDATTLADVFGHLVDELINITADASDSDVVEIRDL